MNEIVIATSNIDKFKEIKSILSDLNCKIIQLNLNIPEDGTTFEENAMKKAIKAFEMTNKISIADDSGLEVEALNGMPGIYSSQFAGNNATYKDNRVKLLKLMENMPFEMRRAKFFCVIAVASSDGCKTFCGEIDGYISTEERGNYGFGYDPVFFIPKIGKTLAELLPEEKNKISHRAIALNKAKEYLRGVAQR